MKLGHIYEVRGQGGRWFGSGWWRYNPSVRVPWGLALSFSRGWLPIYAFCGYVKIRVCFERCRRCSTFENSRDIC